MVNQARTTKGGDVTPISPQTQEIRLATTITGGVSLAVWMGGVTRELDLLTQASNLRRIQESDPADPITLEPEDPLRFYSDLINLLDVSVDVDVLSGTSAGGINAALLAYARVAEKSLESVRGLWLRIGSLISLLREPTDKIVPSLLRGDGQMYASLRREIPALTDVKHKTGRGSTISTTLFITTTLLTGETSRFTDSYGTLVQDVDHRGMFRFTQDNLRSDRPQATATLALAARSTASFPAAFEPSFLPAREPDAITTAIGDLLPRPAVAEYSNITRSHWAADGGLLNNQPIGAVLQKVFERPASRLVRRVLLYVVPSAGPAPDPLAEQPGDDPNQAFGLLGGLLADLGAVKNQSIAADLRAIREHNDSVGARTDMRLRLAQLAGRSDRTTGPVLLTAGLFDDYRQRESENIARSVVAEMMRVLTSWPVARGADAPARSIPPAWAGELVPGGRLEQDCIQAVTARLQTRWSAVPGSFEDLARFDEPALIGAKGIVLSLLRCAFSVSEYDDSATTRAWRPVVLEQIDAVHRAYQPAEGQLDVERLVHQRLEDGDGIRNRKLADAVADLAVAYLDQPDRAALGAGWQRLGAAVQALLAAARPPDPGDPGGPGQGAPATAQPGSPAAIIAAAMANLAIYQEYFDGTATDLDRATLLFALHAAHRAMLPAGAEVDQPVELTQLSADTRTLLDLGRRTAEAKLTGMQFHHFGAFYKQSWRANDWMWGRLDGAGWLVHLLLDPRRINTVAERDNTGSRIGGFLTQLERIGVPPLPTSETVLVSAPDAPVNKYLTRATVSEELAYLDDANAVVPASLPLLSLWVAQSWQQAVLAEELPTLAAAITRPDGSSGVTERSSAQAELWAAQVPSIRERAELLAKASDLLRACPVPDERLATEAGTPLMVHTVSKAAAVTAAAVDSVSQLPGTVRPATSAVRTVTLTGYRVTTLVKSLPRRIILAGAVLLLIGAVLATQQSTLFGLSGLLLAATGGYLVVFGAWQASRALLSAVVSATLVGGAASLTVPAVRRGLFGTATTRGWLGDRLVWLGSAWWHPLGGLGAVLLAFALLGLTFTRLGTRFTAPATRLPTKVGVAVAALVALSVVAVLAIALARQG